MLQCTCNTYECIMCRVCMWRVCVCVWTCAECVCVCGHVQYVSVCTCRVCECVYVQSVCVCVWTCAECVCVMGQGDGIYKHSCDQNITVSFAGPNTYSSILCVCCVQVHCVDACVLCLGVCMHVCGMECITVEPF